MVEEEGLVVVEEEEGAVVEVEVVVVGCMGFMGMGMERNIPNVALNNL